MKTFGIENDDHYLVVLDGNRLVYSNVNKKPCLRKCLSLSKKSSNYVELWYQSVDGSCRLVNFWN